MRRFALYAALAATLTLALAPAIAEARLGRGGSFGSRGGQTYAPPPPTRVAPQPAQPVQRSVTQPASPAAAAATATAPRPGFGGALMGGLLAGGLIGLLLGTGFFGAGFGGVLGALLQLALIGGLVWLGLRLFRAAPAMAGVPAGRGPVPDLGAGRTGTGFAAGGPVPLRLTDEDLASFETALKEVQAAWSEADTAKLAGLLTPEMLGYVTEQLEADARRGVRNRVSGLVFEEGDVSEAWREGVRDYATVAMRYSLTDVDVPVGAPPALPGAAPRETVTELWTFMRVQDGPWRLSAIQQTG